MSYYLYWEEKNLFWLGLKYGCVGMGVVLGGEGGEAKNGDSFCGGEGGKCELYFFNLTILV